MKKIAFIIGTGALGPIALGALPENIGSYKVFTLPDCQIDSGHLQQNFDVNDIAGSLDTLARYKPDLVCMIGGANLNDNHRQQFAMYFLSLFGQDAIKDLEYAQSLPGDQAGSLMLAKIIGHFGAEMVGIHQLIPEIICPVGQIGNHHCPDALQQQMPAAMKLCLAHASTDNGQAVITRNGQVVEQEDRSGTAAMLLRYAKNISTQNHQALLIKCARPGQPLALDMPAIGPNTIDQAAVSDIGLIVLQAGRSLLINRTELIAKADAANIALIGFATEDQNA